jgi:ribosomal-protein-alanine N-acetyltransferase
MPSNIHLVQLQESHIPILYEWKCSEERPEHHTCRPVHPVIPSCDEYREKISARISSGKNIDMVVEDDASGEIVGHIFGFDINPRNKSIEIGYYFPAHSRGKGYGKAALLQFCHYLFTNYDFNKIYATTREFNKPSVAILEYCNFHLDGRNRVHYWIDDKKYDQLAFSLLREEWLQQNLLLDMAERT